MDKATVLGFVGAMGVIGYSMLSKAGLEEVMVFMDIESFLLVFLGSIFCTMISMPWNVCADTVRILKKTFFHRGDSLEALVTRLSEYAGIARKEGKMELERRASADGEDEFFVKGLQMNIDGLTPDEVESALRVELHGLKARHRNGKMLLIVMAKYAPAFGLLTTIVGEVLMFISIGSGLVNVAKIGSGMAFALLGTMYGVILSNVVCQPLADKLEARSYEELLEKELLIQAAVGIAEEISPMAMRQNLVAFLDRRGRERVEGAAEAA